MKKITKVFYDILKTVTVTVLVAHCLLVNWKNCKIFLHGNKTTLLCIKDISKSSRQYW